MEKLNLSAPWVTFVHEVEALFAADAEVKVVFDQGENHLKLFVEDPRKADALAKLLPEEKVFGNVTLKIEVVPANVEKGVIDLFRDALAGNPVVSFVDDRGRGVYGDVSYVVFHPLVAQFFNDQLDDVNGNKSMLYADIAKDIFEERFKVFYCTDEV